MNKTAAIILFTVIQLTTSAQQFNYIFSQTTSAYEELQEAVSLSANLSLNEKYNLSIGFPFVYLGYSFESLSISPAGLISFNNKNNYSLLISENLFIHSDSLIISTISHVTAGAQGNRICKIQFSNFGFENSTPGETLSFQIWLYEENNKIEYHFGPSNIILSPNSFGLILGLVNKQQDTSPWAYVLSGNPVSASGSFLTESDHHAELTNIPVSGTVYVFSVNQ